MKKDTKKVEGYNKILSWGSRVDDLVNQGIQPKRAMNLIVLNDEAPARAKIKIPTISKKK